jgi:hypothetical protein
MPEKARAEADAVASGQVRNTRGVEESGVNAARLRSSGAWFEGSSLFIPKLKAIGMKGDWLDPGRRFLSANKHHQFAIPDDVVARTADGVVAGTSRDGRRDAGVRQASVTELVADDAAQALNRRLLHRVAEQGPGDLGLPHQHVRAVAKLSSTLHELLSGCPGLLRASAHFRREHCATIEMGANAVGQVFMASGASIRAAGEGTREKLVLPERPCAWRAHRYGMVPAIVKEKSAFFAAEPPRQATVEVDHAITVAFDGILRREHVQAARTRQLRFHSILRARSKDRPNFRNVTSD